MEKEIENNIYVEIKTNLFFLLLSPPHPQPSALNQLISSHMMLVKCIAIRCDQVCKHILETNFIVIHFCCRETLFPAIFPQNIVNVTKPLKSIELALWFISITKNSIKIKLVGETHLIVIVANIEKKNKQATVTFDVS